MRRFKRFLVLTFFCEAKKCDGDNIYAFSISACVYHTWVYKKNSTDSEVTVVVFSTKLQSQYSFHSQFLT